MKNRFTLTKNGKPIAEDVVNLSIDTPSFIENEKKFNYEELNGEEKIISFEGIQIFFGEVSTNGLINFDVTYNNPFALLTFEIEGGHKFISENTTLLGIPSNTCNCSYIPSFKGSMLYTSEKRKYFTFIFSKDFISNLLKFHFPKVGKQYLDLIEENKQFNIFSESKKIPFTIHNILNDIMNCYHEDEIKEVFLIGKITELFVILFTEFKETDNKKVSENDVLAEKIKSLILEKFASKITLDEIAKELTSNKTKLKTVFKNRFNQSIIAFKTTTQMVEAKKMLDAKKFTITEVAYKVGYKNPQHFSTAFKKHFNISPSNYIEQNN